MHPPQKVSRNKSEPKWFLRILLQISIEYVDNLQKWLLLPTLFFDSETVIFHLVYFNVLGSVYLKVTRQKTSQLSKGNVTLKKKPQTKHKGKDILHSFLLKPSLHSVMQKPLAFTLYYLDTFKIYFYARMIRSTIASLTCSMKRCSYNTNTAWHSQIPESYSLILGSRCNHPATPCIKC